MFCHTRPPHHTSWLALFPFQRACGNHPAFHPNGMYNRRRRYFTSVHMQAGTLPASTPRSGGWNAHAVPHWPYCCCVCLFLRFRARITHALHAQRPHTARAAPHSLPAAPDPTTRTTTTPLPAFASIRGVRLACRTHAHRILGGRLRAMISQPQVDTRVSPSHTTRTGAAEAASSSRCAVTLCMRVALVNRHLRQAGVQCLPRT